VLQTLGLRSNISFRSKPQTLEVGGRLVGFDTDKIIRVWRFDWTTEQENVYLLDNDPIGILKKDFHLVPYINNLRETMEQQYAVFVTQDPGSNIVFHIKH
jgi:predicted ribosome-associated RNA-binding protein Tma20